MDPHIIFLGGFGLLVLLVAWIPLVIRNMPLSLPIFCVGIGFGLFKLLGEGGLHPRDYPYAVELLTELTVIVALTGAGLRIDRRLTWLKWSNTVRLLGITMPLTIASIAVVTAPWLGLPWATAALIAAVLAPTDPVLAADVQVGPPRSGPEDEVRFSLTSEAGLNDGLAFPFTYLALSLAAYGGTAEAWLWEWFAVDVLWRVAAGTAAGFLVGRLLGALMFRWDSPIALARSGHGFASIGVTFVSYAAAEMIGGYGFIAVFVAALMLRDYEDRHGYHHILHDFIEQMERLLMMVLLVLFGGSLAGTLLSALTWEMAAVGLVILFVLRPLAGMIGLAGSPMRKRERALVSLFGIRGIGSFYYLAFAVNAGTFEQIDVVWTLVSFVVVTSIVVHGITSTPLMTMLDRWRRPDRS